MERKKNENIQLALDRLPILRVLVSRIFFEIWLKVFFLMTYSRSQFVSDDPQNSFFFPYWILDSYSEAIQNGSEWYISDDYLFTRNVSAKTEGFRKCHVLKLNYPTRFTQNKKKCARDGTEILLKLLKFLFFLYY